MFRLRSIILYGAALLLTACQSDEWDGGRTGGIRVTLAETTVNVETKATPAEIVTSLGGDEKLKSQFNLRIVNRETSKDAYSGKYTEQTINVAPGTYQVIASYGDNAVLAWDEPYFYGESTEVTVVENATEATNATVTCGVANSFLEMRFNPKDGVSDPTVFDNLFSEYGIDITGENATYHFTSTEQENGRNPYFKAGSELTFEFVGKLKAGGKPHKTAIDLGTIEGGMKYIVNITMSSISGGSLDITVDKQETTIKENIPLEWLPKPKIEAVGFTDNTLTFAETEQPAASISLTTATELQDVKFKFNFEDEQYASLNKENKEYLLSNAEDKAAIETALGITLPAVGTKDAKIDLAALVAKMQTKAGITTTNTIELDVQANNRWSSENTEANRVYKLVCEKPVFSINAYPGNIWTKEFTINALAEENVSKGDFKTLIADMAYQFSTNGFQWENLDQNLNKNQLTPNTSYYVRGLYRGKVASDVTTIKTYPIISLQEENRNGNLEDWYSEITDDSGKEITKNKDLIYWKKWFPWQSATSKSIWNTVNQTTTQDGAAPTEFLGFPTAPYVGCCYVANSGTIPTDDSHAGKAALIRTVGWGSGSTAAGDVSEIKKVTPGELYIGSYDISNHQPIYGTSYESRPTGFSFYYKYEPKSTDLMTATIVLLAADGTEIGSAVLPDSEAGSNGTWTEKTLDITYTDITKAPAKMYILFKSGSLTDTGILDKPTFGNLSDAESVGSKLYIDDVTLIYDK